MILQKKMILKTPLLFQCFLWWCLFTLDFFSCCPVFSQILMLLRLIQIKLRSRRRLAWTSVEPGLPLNELFFHKHSAPSWIPAPHPSPLPRFESMFFLGRMQGHPLSWALGLFNLRVNLIKHWVRAQTGSHHFHNDALLRVLSQFLFLY